MHIAMRPDFDIAVCGLAALPETIRRTRATHVVSLIDPGCRLPALDIHHSRHFVRRFEDVENAAHPLAPSFDDVADLLDFARKVRAGDSLVVHCFGGTCRSTAAALAILVQALGIHDTAMESAERILREIAPRAIPNMLIASWAGSLLRCRDAFRRRAWKIGSTRTIDLMAELDAG